MPLFRRRVVKHFGLSSLSLVLMSSVFVAAASQSQAESASTASLPLASLPVVSEVGVVPELSNETSTTTRAADGTLTLEAYTTPVNYQGADGTWVPIDNTLVAAPGDAYAVENADGSYTASLPENPATTPVRVESDGVWVTMKMNGLTDDPAVDGAEATYDEVAKADSVTYQATSTGLKEDIVLSAPPAADQPLQYTYALAASPGVTPTVSAVGSVVFKDTTGEVVAEIPRGNLVDSATPLAEMAGGVSYALVQSGAGWTLTMTPDLAWLTDPARVYPVTIDPIVTFRPSFDCWIIKSAPDGHVCGDEALYIRAGRKNADDIYRGLLRFDVSSIPATATVNEAAVSLYVDAAQSYSNEGAGYGFQLAGKPWDWATWNTTGLTGTPWNGGDPYDALRGIRNLNGANSGREDFTGFASIVEGWTDGTIPNNGLVLKQQNEDTNNVLWFKSSSSSAENDGQRPHMEIRYLRAEDLVTEAQGLDIVRAVIEAENDVWNSGAAAVTSPRPTVLARAGGPSISLQRELASTASQRMSVANYGIAIQNTSVSGEDFVFKRLENGDLEVIVSVTTHQTYLYGKKDTSKGSWVDVRKFVLPVRGAGRDPFEVTWLLESSIASPPSQGVEVPATLRTANSGTRSATLKGKTSYDTGKFVDYALKWTDADREDEMNDSFPSFENNCANFASQALDTTWPQTGGVNPNDPENWDPNLTGPFGATDSWANASKLFRYAKNQKNLAHMEYISDAVAGDLLFVDWDGDGDTIIDHVTLITDVWHGMPKISQKSGNRHNMPWAVWREIIRNSDTAGPDPIFFGLHNLVERD